MPLLQGTDKKYMVFVWKMVNERKLEDVGNIDYNMIYPYLMAD